MIGLMPAFVGDTVSDEDRAARMYRVRIPGLTDGSTVLPHASLMNPLGDKSEHTEIRIKPGDRVWLAFEGGDTRYPIIVGFRPKSVGNAMDWRRFEHANFEFNADNIFQIIAGTQVHVVSPDVLIECDNAEVTGNLMVRKQLTFQGGLQGSGGAQGATMVISGTVAVSEDVIAGGTSTHTHGHKEQGDGNRVSNPIP